MIANHIHDALAQVRKLQVFILEKRLFRGYSGTARMLGGLAALTAAIGLASAPYPRTEPAHLAGWGAVLALSLVLNYGALGFWFLFASDARRERLRLMPVIDALPSLAVGAVLSVALVQAGQYRLLPGSWMCLYGLAHIPYRQTLPMPNYAVGCFYLACGAALLLAHPHVPFTNPWPMGGVFFVGELVGGLTLYRNNHRPRTDGDDLQGERNA